MNELFATSADVFRLTGELAPAHDQAATADTLGVELDPDVLDLDNLQRPTDMPAPLSFIHAGKKYMLNGPQDMDWQEVLVGSRNPALFIRYALGNEDQDEFLTSKMPSWKMEALMARYQKHFKLPTDAGLGSGLFDKS